MEQEHAPRDTFMARDWHEGPVPAPSNSLSVGHTEQPVPQSSATAVPEPSALGLMLAVGAAAITLSVIRALRVRRHDRRDRLAEFGRS
ncbi:MAG TPA: PEP-CTERM sorting domain-containing protein [Steroidobacteraceae bacterium]|jgi:hypothetical protein|nr:PEP-CTERM sorting domain-containing protein [Steroidobacteraceae bacterium]